MILVIGGFELFHWKQHKILKYEIDSKAGWKHVYDLNWELRLADHLNSYDFIESSVGTIQFMRRGYSIELQSINYEPTGMVISGFLGNATNVTVSGLTLTLTASKPYYKIREKYLEELKKQEGSQSSWVFIDSGDREIGKGQVLLSMLLPRFRVPFNVTIPNVKQNSEGIELTVSFSGERYSY